jgi:PKD repeat protein
VVVTTPLRGSDEFNRHELGVEFIEPRQSVSVTVHHYRFHELPSDWPEAVGELLAFDATGRVIARDRVAFGPSEGWQRLAVEDPEERITGVELWFDRGSAQENWFVADDLRAETAAAPPTAAFDYSPSDPWPGEMVAFDASASNDRDGRIVSYGWRIASRDPPLLVAFDGDDSAAFDYTFEAAGEYEVRLTVTDDDEMRNTTFRTVVVRGTHGRWPPSSSHRRHPSRASGSTSTARTRSTSTVLSSRIAGRSTARSSAGETPRGTGTSSWSRASTPSP